MARASGWSYLTKIAQLISLIVVAGVLVAGFLIPYFGGVGLAATKAVDKFNNTNCTLAIDPPQQTTTMYASDGVTPIATFFTQNRVIIPYTSMPPIAVIDALVSTEDKRFYDHHGVDLKGLIRAAVNNSSSGNTQGGSTLTEQYVKQVNYYNAISKGDTAAANAAIDQDVNRKIADAKCALQIEKQFSKAQILEKYLNIAYFGESAYGIERAAQTYFGVDASKLTIAEGAMIVGLVQAPSQLDPYNDLQAARDRRDLVLTNMATQNYISATDEAAAKASPIVLVRQTLPPRGCAYANTKIVNVGFFCDYAYNWLTSPAGGGLSAEAVNTGGLKIVTTLQAGLQNQGQAAIAASGLDPKNDYLLAMPSVKPSTGEVTTMITDKHYGTVRTPAGKPDPAYTVNPIFTAAYAGSGSTYKYFSALAALTAGADGNLTLTTPSPYTIKECTDPANLAYRAANAGPYAATLPLYKALPQSSNTYFVGLEDQFFGCNIGPIVHTATGLGMNALLAKNSDGKTRAQALIDGQSMTFTLGQEPTSSLELTGAFAALANDGVLCQPHPIKLITDTTGAKVPFKQATCSRQFSSYVARTLVNIMTSDTTGVNGGTASVNFAQNGWYSRGGSLVAAKTGTNNATTCPDPKNAASCYDNGLNSSLWFVGITPNLTSAAALINPTNPNLSIAQVAGITDGTDGHDTFGAYGSRYWLSAYGPALIHQQWTWPTVDSTPGSAVPIVSNVDPDTAISELATAGFRGVVLPNETCAAKTTAGFVAYYSPKIALPNAVINLCLSSGIPPVAAPTPTPTKTKPKVTAAPPVVTPPAAPPVVKPPATPAPKPSKKPA